MFLGAIRLAVTMAEELGEGGSIAFVLSTSAKAPIPDLGISNGLRPGLAMAAKNLADELGPRGIRVNGLLPGRVDTDRVRQLDAQADDPAAARAATEQTIPLRRYGKPEEFGSHRRLPAVACSGLPDRRHAAGRRRHDPKPVSSSKGLASPGADALRDLDYPALVLHEDALESNLATMADYCTTAGILHAPHAKTSLSPQIVERHLRHGAWAMTAATPAQVRGLHRLGVGRILLANVLVDDAAIRWVAEHLLTRTEPDTGFWCYADSIAGVCGTRTRSGRHGSAARGAAGGRLRRRAHRDANHGRVAPRRRADRELRAPASRRRRRHTKA